MKRVSGESLYPFTKPSRSPAFQAFSCASTTLTTSSSVRDAVWRGLSASCAVALELHGASRTHASAVATSQPCHLLPCDRLRCIELTSRAKSVNCLAPKEYSHVVADPKGIFCEIPRERLHSGRCAGPRVPRNYPFPDEVT